MSFRSTRVNYSVFLLIFIFLLKLTFKTTSVFAQVDSVKTGKKINWWLNTGIGGGGYGIASGTILSFQWDKMIFSIRTAGTSDFYFDEAPDVTRNAGDIAILYGKCSKSKYGFSSISVGIAYVMGTKSIKYYEFNGTCEIERHRKREYKTLGIPVEIQLFFTPFSFMGIGLYGFGNFNKEIIYEAVLLCIQIGKLR